MSATSKSTKIRLFLKTRFGPAPALLSVLLLIAFIANVRADDAPNPVFVKRFENAFNAAKAKLAADTNNPAALWQFARAAFDWADIQTANARRAEIANQGIAATQRLIAQDPKSVEGHYYLAMSFAELAQTETLGALKLVREMETEFALVLKADPAFDHAGADRNLGLLYRDAPGWPTSIGNRAKAKQHLQQAAIVSPDFPENVMNLIESELKWGDDDAVKRDMKTLDELWPKAQKQFAGEEWESSWADWTKRRDEARKKAVTAPNISTSPHNKTSP
jgi:tetratricopeptide (TPR) repeat protein